ncbi:MAG: hypothetical protein AAB215_07250 [Planctomycetota bacterium]
MNDVIYYVSDFVRFLRLHVPPTVWIGLGLGILILWYFRKLLAAALGFAFVVYILAALYVVQNEYFSFENPIPFIGFLVMGVGFAVVTLYLFFIRTPSE